MEINRNNYESYFIDYYDGTLTAEQVAGLFLFLEQNHDLKEEFESFGNFKLEAVQEEFQLSDSLKRGEINQQNFSWHMAASVEGDLSEQEQRLLDTFLANHPSFRNDEKLFHAAKLDPQNHEVFPGKKSLKQPVPMIPWNIGARELAIAALILLTLITGGYLLLTRSQQENKIEFAGVPDRSAPVNEQQPVMNESVQPAQEENGNPGKEKKKIESTPQVNDKPGIKYPAEKSRPEMQIAEQVPEIEINHIEPSNTSSMVAEVKPRLVQPSNSQPVASSGNKNPGNENASSNDEYLTVWEALRRGAENNLRKATGNNTDETPALADNETKEDVKLTDIIGKGLEKVSNDKVKLDTKYNDDGKLSAFHFAAGKFRIDRTRTE